MTTLVSNRKARYDYEFLQTLAAGLVLSGYEVKAIRAGKASIVDCFAIIDKGEIWLKKFNITYDDAPFRKEAGRDIKLLLKKREINRLESSIIKGLTIIPTKIFLNERSIIKCEIVLARGKKNYDKRETIKDRDADRELRRAQAD